MRLALFTDTFIPQMNGVARTLERLTGHLQRRGVEHLIFTPKSADDDFYVDPVRPIASIPFFLYPECRLALPNVTALRAELDRFKPDLLHMATPFNIGLCGLRYARKNRIPHVASYHTHFDRYLEYYRMGMAIPLYWTYMRWFHRSCGLTFAPSHETIGTLNRQGFHNVRLWSRGVDCRLFTPDKRSSEIRERHGISAPLILLYVGRIAPEKDIDTLSAIMKALPDSVSSRVHWLIVGDGPLLPELREQAPDNVTFTGYKEGEELAQLYASADLFVFPSGTETFGNVALEAMASGLPVVGADAGGVKETVVHGLTGALCAPRDPASFIRAIGTLAERPERLAEAGAEARRTALTRSWDSVFDGLLDSYRQTADGRSLVDSGVYPA